VKDSAAPQLVRTEHVVEVLPPFRLDLTASALRRLPTNQVDVITGAGSYMHAVAAAHGPAIVKARQSAPDHLSVSIDADARDSGLIDAILAHTARSLGANRELDDFYRASASVVWLAPLARRLRGLKPPRYRDLWEAFVNAVVYQQVSLHAASAVVQRMVAMFGTRLESGGSCVSIFPAASCVLAASDDTLTGLGLSAGKLATLRRASDAIDSGALDEAELDSLPTEEIARRLQSIKGIGPWTAAVILLRGLGRLDVFPMNDSGVARNLALAAGGSALRIEDVTSALGDQRGMLYYHLLLARLEAKGETGSPTVQPG
jgi:DNA-3-methyladenine glycosylase II